LRDVQALRRAAEMQLLGDGDEIAEMAQFNVSYIHRVLIEMNNILDILFEE
jgi:hypothetical protein